MSTRLLTATLLLMQLTVVHAQQQLDTPETIIEAIRVQSPQAVVRAMFKAGTWRVPFLRAVSEAKSDWLKVAAALAPGTDGGSGEDLSDALSEALLTNPELALPIIQPIWWPHGEQVCLFGTDSELPGGVSSYIAHLTSALSDSSSPKFAPLKADCLKGLNATQHALSSEAHVG